MNERIEEMLNDVLNKKHYRFRQEFDIGVFKEYATNFSTDKLADVQRVTERLEHIFNLEKPVVLPDEKIAFLRTVSKIPDVFTTEEWEDIKSRHYIHELGKVCNICPDYASTIRGGLEERRKEALQSIKACEEKNNTQGIEFLKSAIRTIDAVESLAGKYASEAEKAGNKDVASVLQRVPRVGAETFHEALQFFRILHYTLWCSGNYHNTVGRFDQYMYPYLKADLDSGRLTYDEAFELLEEFFISFNKDSDLYPGMQQGDNGQSMILGGVDEDGNDAYNLLSEMCLKASLELKLIDPKINLRVGRNTGLEIFELGTQLTKQGLGFPQYSNDDIVIPGLLEKGYSLKDARNYVVAACWEFIIPGAGMDIPNIGALSFTKAIDAGMRKCISKCKDFEQRQQSPISSGGRFSIEKAVNGETQSPTDVVQTPRASGARRYSLRELVPDSFRYKRLTKFEQLMEYIKDEIIHEVDEEVARFENIYMEPAPFLSILMDGCITNARDISSGGKYNNFGLHGTGIATAADSLAAVKKFVFQENEVTLEEIINAIDANFKGFDDLWLKLRYDAPKMGNDDDFVDSIAIELLDIFAEALKNKVNERGGCYRAGTGSAMYYLWHVKEVNASADGRKKGEPLSANFSPSLNIRAKGPVSIIRSFSKPDMKHVINGGPLTLELHDTVFRNNESIQKVAMLVKSYMDLGGHQLQLNAVNRDKLLDAQKNPESYRNLIVRVWGWSGYFVELDKEYQDHIIQRVELKL